MSSSRFLLTASLVVVCVLAVVSPLAAQESPPAQGAALSGVSSHPDYDDRPAREPGADAPPRLGVSTLLQWDDGSYETGLGVNINAAYDGQIGMRFGGSPATTGLVPMKLRGAYWRMFGGFAGATSVNLNFWQADGNNLPTNLLAQAPGNTNTTTTQFASLTDGPTIVSSQGSVMVGVGVLGTSSWFVAGDSTAPSFQRQFFGAGTDSSQAWDYGPATLSGYGFGWDFLIRLLVDGNIPVELELVTAGECPGDIQVDISGAVANRREDMLGSRTMGDSTVPMGNCAGTELDVGPLTKRWRSAITDDNGDASFDANIGAGLCGAFIQGFDADCSTSNVATLGALNDCTIEFDSSCPDSTPECGATFTGGDGCVTEGLFFCYNSGAFSYRVAAGDTLTIDLVGDVNALDVFFVAGGAEAGEMSFFDIDGMEVDSPITTNGDCTGSMQAVQSVAFSTPVRQIQVTAPAGNQVYLDSFQVNPE